MINNGVEMIISGIVNKNILTEKQKETIKYTPDRVARMYERTMTYDKTIGITEEGKKPFDTSITIFPTEEGMENQIQVSSSVFMSWCSHHKMPFLGRIYFAYIPDKYYLGLSKFNDIVKYYSGRFQMQEEMVNNIAKFIEDNIKPMGFIIIASAIHTCKLYQFHDMYPYITSQVSEFFKDDKLKSEAMRLMGVIKWY